MYWLHVQLKTRTKLFCRCSTEFGAAAEYADVPGLHRHARQSAGDEPPGVRAGAEDGAGAELRNPGLHQVGPEELLLSRSAEGLPDQPVRPAACRTTGTWTSAIRKAGFADRRVGIIRAHLEEDAGKSMHDEVAGKADSRIDLNRTGTPLLEIVTQPDLRSPDEAKAYLTELKLLLSYLDVSDCNMQEGSLRVDANVNLHIDTPHGTVATPIVEIKNMNSFRAVERALAYEAERQYQEWRETGQKLGDVPKQTRGWDDQAQVTRAQRHKEESSDYRYFPDPDLVPVRVTPEEIAAAAQSLDELPAALRERLTSSYGTGSRGCRCTGQSRSSPSGLFRAGGGPVPGSQAGRQLDPARCASHTP